jgi:hypothetical protein
LHRFHFYKEIFVAELSVDLEDLFRPPAHKNSAINDGLADVRDVDILRSGHTFFEYKCLYYPYVLVLSKSNLAK